MKKPVAQKVSARAPRAATIDKASARGRVVPVPFTKGEIEKNGTPPPSPPPWTRGVGIQGWTENEYIEVDFEGDGTALFRLSVCHPVAGKEFYAEGGNDRREIKGWLDHVGCSSLFVLYAFLGGTACA